jgi:Mn2+/Fe2+ NRAMP family transporter
LALGPGLVFVLDSLGPSDLVTGSIAGAKYGYSLIWLLVAALFARFVIVDATARYVMVTGESLLAGFGRISRWIALLWFGVTILMRHLAALTKIVLLGSAAHLVLPLPTRYSVAIWGLSSWTAAFALMYWGRYRLFEKLCKPFAVILGSCLVITAVLSRPDPADLVRGVLTPVLPMGQGLYSPALVVMAVMSASMASFGNLKYSAYVHEKGWRDLSFLPHQRRELLASMCGMFCMLAMIQIAAAGALKPRGIEVGRLEDLVPIFADALGYGGRTILGVTLWSIVFTSALGETGYGIMISDVYYRFVRPSPAAAQRNQAAGEMPAYRWMVLYVFLSPLYAVFTGWTPVGLVLVKAAANVSILPIAILAVLRLTADKKIMGTHTNGWFTNIVLGLTTLLALYLGYRGVVELWISRH